MPRRGDSVSNSFNKEQLEVLVFVFESLLRGGDPRMIVRNKGFQDLAAKILRMREKMNKLSAPTLSEVLLVEASEAAEKARSEVD